MAHSEIHPIAQKWLLRRYEPVLRFSAGEHFFPMRVDWFIANSRLMKNVRLFFDRPINRFFSRRRVTVSEEEIRRRQNDLARHSTQEHVDYYLRFVPGRSPIINLLIVALALFHMTIIYLLLNSLGSRFVGFEPLAPLGIVKAGVLVALFIMWPFIEAKRKVHLALILNVAAALFYGTRTGALLGVLFLAIIIAVVSLQVFTILTNPFQTRRQSGGRSNAISNLFNLARLAFTGLTVYVAAALAFRLLEVELPGLILYLGPDLGWLPADPVQLVTFGAIGSLFLLLLWFSIGNIVRNHQTGTAQHALFHLPVPPRDAQFVVLFLSSSVIAMVYLLGLSLGYRFHDSQVSALEIALLSAAAAGGIWFLIGPLKFVTRNQWILPNNLPTYVQGWNWRVHLLVILTASAWTIGSLYALAGRFDRPLLFIIINVLITIVVLGIDIFRYLTDVISIQPDSDALRAARRYLAILDQHEYSVTRADQRPRRFTYYGRATEQDGWIILQYFYFYAFNNSRSHAGGLNNHEGDWEAVSIFLKRRPKTTGFRHKALEPFGVAYSQHHDGTFCFWEPPPGVEKPRKKDRVVTRVARVDNSRPDTCHPLVYPALGSHANFAWPDLYPTTARFHGLARDALIAIDNFLSGFMRPRTSEKRDKTIPGRRFFPDVQTRLSEPLGQLSESVVAPLKNLASDLDPQYDPKKVTRTFPGAVPIEYAAGDGMRIGRVESDFALDDEFKWSARLPDTVVWRETEMSLDRDPTNSWEDGLLVIEGFRYLWINDSRDISFVDEWKWEDLTWECELISEQDPQWVEFPGRWGRHSISKNEAGPPGPKWDRPERADMYLDMRKLKQRLRWGDPDKGDYGLDWMYTLLFQMANDEDVSNEARRHALTALTSGDRFASP